MKMWKVMVLAVVAVIAVSGCKKPIKKGDAGAASGYQDVPLTEYSLEDFSKPSAELEYVFQNVHFDYNKYDIKSSEAPILEGIAKWMNDNSAKHVLVEGHCDERGSNEYNMALGEQRALSVRHYLISLGIEAEKLHTVSYGEERPADAGHDEAAWAKNRRAEFLISNK
jgi:peptidoglycan-associated lipoprotein